MRVDVTARRSGDQYLVECSDCGPVGVVDEVEAVVHIRSHLRSHGVETIEEGAPE